MTQAEAQSGTPRSAASLADGAHIWWGAIDSERQAQEVVSWTAWSLLLVGLAPLGALGVSAARQELSPSVWSASVALCQLAVGHELLGASRKMLELARQHAVERTQFDQIIGKFQAVRHRLAETLVALEAADAMLGAAWEDGSPTTAAVAKALAGRASRTAARHCQQVLAGIGFTTEHEFHHYVRRVLVLGAFFGGTRSLTKELGVELLTSQRLPALVPL